jgi:hypothetical protein
MVVALSLGRLGGNPAYVGASVIASTPQHVAMLAGSAKADQFFMSASS